jgi:hypothetical protein
LSQRNPGRIAWFITQHVGGGQMSFVGEGVMRELDALWRVRFGQPLPVVAEPELIIRVMRMVEEKRLAQASEEALSQA